jgi:hypothetical protein
MRKVLLLLLLLLLLTIFLIQHPYIAQVASSNYLDPDFLQAASTPCICYGLAFSCSPTQTELNILHAAAAEHRHPSKVQH